MGRESEIRALLYPEEESRDDQTGIAEVKEALSRGREALAILQCDGEVDLAFETVTKTWTIDLYLVEMEQELSPQEVARLAALTSKEVVHVRREEMWDVERLGRVLF